MIWTAELRVAELAARDAASAINAVRMRGVKLGSKGGGEIVTDADLAADLAIRQQILTAFPDDLIYSEESCDSSQRAASRRVWIIDPLDGTGGFARGDDEYAISIGLAVDGQAVVGAVYVAATQQVYCGGVDHGAWRDGIAIAVADCALMHDARTLMSRKELAANIPLGNVRPIARGSMACKLALLAAGEAELVLSFKDRHEWGSCAGTAVVAAAGGIVTDLHGAPLTFNRPLALPRARGIVASGKQLHPAALAYAQRVAGFTP